MAKVLVVDDSLSVRTVVERALKSRRIDVVSAASGTEAMSQIRSEEPDLVVCDVIMPDMEGYEICEFVRDHPRLARTPVLLMSGIVNSSVLARAAEARSTDVIRKPFAADELLSKIVGLLPDSDAVPEPGSPAPGAAAPAQALAGAELDACEPPAEAAVEDLKGVLSRLAAVPGVSLAVLVDREGFLIEAAGDMMLEAEVAGALAACLAECSEGIGRELDQGSLQGLLLEYEAGTVLVNAAGSAAMLAIVLCDAAMLGKVRYYVTKTLPQLLQAL
jgi:twitching motility two-component system response regulator PilG